LPLSSCIVPPALPDSVPVVVEISAKEQMGRIATSAVVAGVTNEGVSGISPVEIKIGNSMSQNGATSAAEPTISSRDEGSGPKPTLVSLFNLGKESGDSRLREDNWSRLSSHLNLQRCGAMLGAIAVASRRFISPIVLDWRQ
jgi:hypothetical protein